MKNKITPSQTKLENKMKQFEDALATSKELLNARMEENILLKYRISEILRNNFDQNFLEEIEEFQTRLIWEDELINLLRKDVSELEKFILSKEFEIGKTEQLFSEKIEQLQKEIEESATSFRISKSAFESFQNQRF